MEIKKEFLCHATNHQKGRKQPIKYLVIHYVGAKGGARNNAKYYGTAAGIQSSAHYFVGHASEGCPIYLSVAEGDTAWHCGTNREYRHPECRNANSIGIEICCHQDGKGTWYFDSETVDRTVELARDIMGRHGISLDHVVRHYDVTGKICPAPFVHDVKAWENFKNRLKG